MAAEEGGRLPWTGARQLIASIDIGTTYTSASYTVLQPGKIPQFQEILRWPQQASADAKVPSVIYYDKEGQPKAFGAATEDEEVAIEAEEENWIKAAWWKLLLRPAHLHVIKDLDITELPPSIDADKVFEHYMGYVVQQLELTITQSYGEGAAIWTSLSPTMDWILTTPNGWEGIQQNRMRQSAIKAGLVDANGGNRIKFVTEAEAAILYAADSGAVGDWLKRDNHLIICDCGGGTIDITGYKITATQPLRLEESAASRCYLAGAVFVNKAAEAFLKSMYYRLEGTEWDTPIALSRALVHFEKNAKRKFDHETEKSWINLEGSKSNSTLGIVRGRLKVNREEMKTFFAGSVEKIKEGIETAIENNNRHPAKVILVGGLCGSPYVFSELERWGKTINLSVSRPDGPTVKAVPNGALSWAISSTVAARVARNHYGIEVTVPSIRKDPECRARYATRLLDGSWVISGGWASIVAKNTPIEADKEYERAFYREIMPGADMMNEVTIIAYRKQDPPKFITFPKKRTFQPGFDRVCVITTDLTPCYKAARWQTNHVTKKEFKKVEFKVCIKLGATEMTARLYWKEQNRVCFGPATVAYAD